MSYNFNRQQVLLQWSPEEPVSNYGHNELPEFTMTSHSTDTNYDRKAAGDWVELVLRFTFKRRNIWFFFQLYIPTYLVIFISWISFSLDPKAIPARTCLGVSSLLFLVMLYGNITRSLPRVSYVKAIDVWVLSCMTFVFLSLLELAVVSYVNEQETKSEEKLANEICEGGALLRRDSIDKHYYLHRPYGSYQGSRECLAKIQTPNILTRLVDRIGEKMIMKAATVDHVCASLFPTLFSIFNIIYWTYYSSKSENIFKIPVTP